MMEHSALPSNTVIGDATLKLTSAYFLLPHLTVGFRTCPCMIDYCGTMKHNFRSLLMCCSFVIIFLLEAGDWRVGSEFAAGSLPEKQGCYELTH
jgi:hypothetical protein